MGEFYQTSYGVGVRKAIYSSLSNKVIGWNQLDLKEQVGVLEAVLLYFNFIFHKTGNYITHQNFSSDEVINGR
jgi:hypothetical protein